MMKRAFGLVLVVAGFAVVSAQEGGQAPARGGRGAGPEEQLVLSLKVKKLNEYVAPHKPHTKLADVLAKHKGRQTGSSRSSTTKTSMPTTSRWGRVNRRRAG
jgi:hypothetical protein